LYHIYDFIIVNEENSMLIKLPVTHQTNGLLSTELLICLRRILQ